MFCCCFHFLWRNSASGFNMAAPVANGVPVEENVGEIHQQPAQQSEKDQKRPQFGTRFLTDPRQVFQHNAWYSILMASKRVNAGYVIGITLATWAHDWVCIVGDLMNMSFGFSCCLKGITLSGPMSKRQLHGRKSRRIVSPSQLTNKVK